MSSLDSSHKGVLKTAHNDVQSHCHGIHSLGTECTLFPKRVFSWDDSAWSWFIVINHSPCAPTSSSSSVTFQLHVVALPPNSTTSAWMAALSAALTAHMPGGTTAEPAEVAASSAIRDQRPPVAHKSLVHDSAWVDRFQTG